MPEQPKGRSGKGVGGLSKKVGSSQWTARDRMVMEMPRVPTLTPVGEFLSLRSTGFKRY